MRGTPDANAEDNVPVEGLVNINTANWKILATLPLVVNPATGVADAAIETTSGLTYRQLNANLAKAIVYYRDVDGNENTNIRQPHGPFRSIYELNRVVDLRPGRPALSGIVSLSSKHIARFSKWLFDLAAHLSAWKC